MCKAPPTIDLGCVDGHQTSEEVFAVQLAENMGHRLP